MKTLKSKEDFYECLHFKHPISHELLEEVEDLRSKYPFSAILNTLTARVRFQLNTIDFEEKIGLYALSVHDRALLKEYIHRDHQIFEKEIAPIEHKEILPEKSNDLEKLEQSYYSELISQQYVLEKPEDAAEEPEDAMVIDERKIVLTNTPDSTIQPSKEKGAKTFSQWLEALNSEKTSNYKNLENITHFIDDVKKRESTEFFSASKMAKKSLIENEDVVSETLANIYLKQGHYEKAKKAYAKLSLLVPEKKHYFANKIKQIEELNN